MGRGTASQGSEHDPSGRRANHRAAEARLSPLLDRTYAARAVRVAPVDDALAKLNAALDAIGSPPRRHTDHRRLFGACALVVLLLLLPVARAEFAVSPRNAARSVVIPIDGAVGGRGITGPASGRTALPPVTVAVSEGSNTTGRAPVAGGMAPVAEVRETPLRDLLARAGIHASDPLGGSSIGGDPPHH